MRVITPTSISSTSSSWTLPISVPSANSGSSTTSGDKNMMQHKNQLSKGDPLQMTDSHPLRFCKDAAALSTENSALLKPTPRRLSPCRKRPMTPPTTPSSPQLQPQQQQQLQQSQYRHVPQYSTDISDSASSSSYSSFTSLSSFSDMDCSAMPTSPAMSSVSSSSFQSNMGGQIGRGRTFCIPQSVSLLSSSSSSSASFSNLSSSSGSDFLVPSFSMLSNHPSSLSSIGSESDDVTQSQSCLSSHLGAWRSHSLHRHDSMPIPVNSSNTAFIPVRSASSIIPMSSTAAATPIVTSSSYPGATSTPSSLPSSSSFSSWTPFSTQSVPPLQHSLQSVVHSEGFFHSSNSNPRFSTGAGLARSAKRMKSSNDEMEVDITSTPTGPTMPTRSVITSARSTTSALASTSVYAAASVAIQGTHSELATPSSITISSSPSTSSVSSSSSSALLENSMDISDSDVRFEYQHHHYHHGSSKSKANHETSSGGMVASSSILCTPVHPSSSLCSQIGASSHSQPWRGSIITPASIGSNPPPAPLRPSQKTILVSSSCMSSSSASSCSGMVSSSPSSSSVSVAGSSKFLVSAKGLPSQQTTVNAANSQTNSIFFPKKRNHSAPVSRSLFGVMSDEDRKLLHKAWDTEQARTTTDRYSAVTSSVTE